MATELGQEYCQETKRVFPQCLKVGMIHLTHAIMVSLVIWDWTDGIPQVLGKKGEVLPFFPIEDASTTWITWELNAA